MGFFCINCKKEIDPEFKACPYCGEQITDFLRTYLGRPIDGKYEIISRLGIGGMGEVYKVLHVHLKSIRVVKLMRPALSSQEEATSRFLREARLATRINHPHVATLFDFSTLRDGMHYMVWEYIEGTNLAQVIRRKGMLTPHYAARLSIDALLGLDAIHRAGIVHRDVSPENLMITLDDDGDERVKIIDLGIAKRDDAAEDKTKTGVFVGKWKYCSPEHLGVLEAGQRIDGRADIYSFGIVLFEMLTGRTPFIADSPHDYLVQHATAPPPPIAELNPVMSHHPELEAIILKALEKDRGKRFQTARQFADALRDILPSLESTDLTESEEGAASASEAISESSAVTGDFTVPVGRGTVHGLAPSETPTVTQGELTPFEHATLKRSMPDSSTRRSKSWFAILAIVAILAVAVTAIVVLRRGASHGGSDSKVVPAPRPASGHVAVDAFPWAIVETVRNVDSGKTLQNSKSIMTPARLDLEPGRWELTLSNPRFSEPKKKIVDLRAGERASVMVEFASPADANLPRFIEDAQ